MFKSKFSRPKETTSDHQVVNDKRKKSTRVKEIDNEVRETQKYTINNDHIRRNIEAKLEELKGGENLFEKILEKKSQGTDHVGRPGRKDWLDDKSKDYIDSIDDNKKYLPKDQQEVINEMMESLCEQAGIQEPKYLKGHDNPFSGPEKRDGAEIKCAKIADKLRLLAILCENKAKETSFLNISGGSSEKNVGTSSKIRRKSDSNIYTAKEGLAGILPPPQIEISETGPNIISEELKNTAEWKVHHGDS